MTSKALLIAWLSPLKVGSLSFRNYLDVLYEWGWAWGFTHYTSVVEFLNSLSFSI